LTRRRGFHVCARAPTAWAGREGGVEKRSKPGCRVKEEGRGLLPGTPSKCPPGPRNARTYCGNSPDAALVDGLFQSFELLSHRYRELRGTPPRRLQTAPEVLWKG